MEALAQSCLERVADRDPLVRAWTHVDPFAVLAQARELDRTGPTGPLHGVPIGIKDVILTRDMPTQYNSALYRGFHPAIDAACVAVLRAAGALLFGKTDTVEFAATGRQALTRNPHDFERTPGGSSSGSAAAVADCHVPLSLGTQTGGSIIRPASFCGIAAMKPSWGLVSTEGVRHFAPSLDTVGWFARSVADLRLLHELFDPHTAAATPPPATSALRIGVCRSPIWDEAEPSTRNALQDACAALEAAGAVLCEMELPPAFASLFEAHRVVMEAEAGASFLPEYWTHGERLAPVFRSYVERASSSERTTLREAQDLAARCRAEFDARASGFDAVLTPSSAGSAPQGFASTGSYRFNALWTLLHGPCINLPAGRIGALPVGLTLIAPRYADHVLLTVAAAIAPLLAAGSHT